MAKQEYRNERMIASYKAIDLDSRSDATMPKDHHFVLYLRSFAQDNAIKIGNFNFETSLTYVLANYVDVVALDWDSKKLGPVPISATDDNWLTRVEALAGLAALIVLIPAPTVGVIAEIGMLQAKRFFYKTLFVAPPQGSRSSLDIPKLWEELRAEANKLEIPPYVSDGFIFTLDDEGQLRSWDTLGLDLEPPPLAAKPTDRSVRHNHDLSFSHHRHHMAHVAATDAMYHHIAHASSHHFDHSSHHHHHHHRHDS